MALIVLKIDVDTLRGTREGVPNLVRMLRAHEAGATFLFSLGPDHTGWALRRAFRPGFLKKVSRTSVVEHYGLRTLMYGVLLPGPDIGRKAAAEMRAVAEAGFETGIHTWDHVRWQDNVRQRDAAWTARQMGAAHARFAQIFGQPPVTHGAAGWQMNDHAFRQIDAWDMAYASDGRGTHPYIPSVDGQPLKHVQLPTTLPTLDECIGVDGLTTDTVARHLLKMTESDRDQVFTLHAELEGQKLAPIFQELLGGWRTQGHRLASMGDYYATLDRNTLPVQPVTWGEIPGRSGSLIVQPA
ncbi:4-deoxy-4-formamido-L-arabinose-phosphoundecaprenol deformylase [Ralstonia syzygii subsp. celebesensis]|uniref:4-deoxy-4-formamido-L-arabinose-phosphoundecaprenol deformylase n=3 Tax=Ralstonia solanacearum species complex TaxID=3116862 RepID=A0AAD0S6B2_RALSL|nr:MULTISPECIES: 4-deoxy-4-formamido-L-arabinose-phosphoundecaprenol deformylase [Ralstonia solanacearum species complex]CCA82372.1 polysaccharide deacetylase; protein [blood disease bacterium R229]AQW28775.1 4-deoxy-4-formamido-L-arabinose-phosphoundecaprenol deformylase [blood disease bacterium A2-HR MARDI]AXV81791.1 4-deoxy-4-formamido-L-arabinose-phosphoundecaprenol deformylase [Ralstonia solanacearum]AXW52927.1 4-deoxy-4-formamido-L-arabinose-phosphoundecaprenol deformylase [Ralstonia sola